MSAKPLQTLLASLTDAREHEVPFERAWDKSVEDILASLPQHQRPDWEYALHCTREAWQDAYLGQGDPPAGVGSVALNLDVD